MKLATKKNTSKDGQLVVVSKDLSRAIAVAHIAATLQQALDEWDVKAPLLHEVYLALCADTLPESFAFEPAQCHSPLPRAFQWADGSAYVNHVELVRKARGAEMPESFWTEPLMYQGGSDDFLGPQDDIVFAQDNWGIDFEGEVAVVTSDVPMGTSSADAGKHIRLLMLVNDVSLRGLIPAELAKGFGFFQSKPSSAFSPLAVTPDELGDNWREHKVHLPLVSHYNQTLFGKPNAGQDMTFDFSQLVAHAAKTRNLGSGTIIGSGTVSNKQGTGWGSSIADGGVGYSCIAELRMIETIRDGQASTPFMAFGDIIKIEMLDENGLSIFGAIEQQVSKL
ncbi:fumarylacetoacetate hydrolase family protein [Paraglaciecola hydrolytica]|uniref:2-keto-4-pentenoate hydratase n=1 Tax=Paraglaciecola hydrolytica TaxID=1799789 RepID=A0A148KNU7_9ALTE|nr:fumarylacetoacetate hydrolase family protein [Paraglaciecola hydrolytica]KXI27977.1 2-keto-4-pentenoate hydratase [Paraglaciecola hydrolytica]